MALSFKEIKAEIDMYLDPRELDPEVMPIEKLMSYVHSCWAKLKCGEVLDAKEVQWITERVCDQMKQFKSTITSTMQRLAEEEMQTRYTEPLNVDAHAYIKHQQCVWEQLFFVMNELHWKALALLSPSFSDVQKHFEKLCQPNQILSTPHDVDIGLFFVFIMEQKRIVSKGTPLSEDVREWLLHFQQTLYPTLSERASEKENQTSEKMDGEKPKYPPNARYKEETQTWQVLGTQLYWISEEAMETLNLDKKIRGE